MKMGALQSQSQETNTFHVPRADNTREDLRKGPTVPMLSADSTRLGINGNLGLVENNVVMSPSRDILNSILNLDKIDSLSDDDRVVGLKRKRSPKEVESFECLPTELINFPSPIEENQAAALNSQIVRNSNDMGDGRFSTALLLDNAHASNYMPNKKSKLNQSTETSLDDMTGEEILKLLELDDPDDEERFKMEMEMPLSPTLPEIEMPSLNAFEVDNSIVQNEVISNVRTNEIYSNEMMEMMKQPLGRVFKYFVAFPNMEDNTSISRIRSACETCLSSSSTVSPKVWMVKEFLVAVAEQEDLQAEEKACVFFSLLLHNFLDIMPANFTSVFADNINSCWSSFLTHMKSVMSNAELRNKLLQLFHLDTLLSLIESFILHKRVLSVSLSSEQATTDTLVAASFILASICATTGRIGFVCEVSYKLLRMCRADSCSMLITLHAFALVCGSTYLNLRSHSLVMAVIRCIVSLVEREIASESLPCFHQCAECVFSKGLEELSGDDVSSLLFEKLQECTVVSRTGNQPQSDISDVISLVELLAYYMGWEWTSRNIIPSLLKIAYSSMEEEALSAIILLIGQLGRFGIDQSGGIEPLGVEELRCNLEVFLNQNPTRNWSLPTQMAIIHSLTTLISGKFEEVVTTQQHQHLLHANAVKEWFSQLNEDHKSLSLRLLVQM